MTSATPSPSPRKTRASSRSVPAKAESTPDPTLFDPQPIPTVAVMQASSMEPVAHRRALPEKRPRHKMTEHQLQRLEELYQANTHPSREEKDELANEIGMTLKSVMIWFQNRRQDRRRKPSTAAVMARAMQASNTPETTPSPAPQPAGPRKRPAKPLPARAADKRVKLATPKASASPAPSPLLAAQATLSDKMRTHMETDTTTATTRTLSTTTTSRSETTVGTRPPRLPDSSVKSRTGATSASQKQHKGPRTSIGTSIPRIASFHLSTQGESRSRRRSTAAPESMTSSSGEESASTMNVDNSPPPGTGMLRALLGPSLTSSRASSVTVRDSSRDAFRHVHFKASSPPSPQHSHCTATSSTFASPPSSTSTLPISNSSDTPSTTAPQAFSYRSGSSLEWACANSAARRKHGLIVYRDEDDSSGESTDFEDDLAAHKHRRKGKNVLRPSKRRRLHIPEEYHTICSPDLVLGATLLLGLKHSVDLV